LSEWAIDILFRCRSELKPEIRTQVELVPIHKFYHTCFVSTRLLSIEILGLGFFQASQPQLKDVLIFVSKFISGWMNHNSDSPW
jgi:uncharacterized membrane protein YiaA